MLACMGWVHPSHKVLTYLLLVHGPVLSYIPSRAREWEVSEHRASSSFVRMRALCLASFARPLRAEILMASDASLLIAAAA
ncbi:hypothetical protein F4780DRAFT_728862 [Xylariomycetidae sp. FL0641]|nr:hypothetical protein F4780DRAFT_728862 [Xylariomycetidae sp. FL0641]